LERRWDGARDEEAELRVTLARAESDMREIVHRMAGMAADRQAAMARIGIINREVEELRQRLISLSELRDSAAGEISLLFETRDGEIGALAVVDAALAELDTDLAELGERVRIARRHEAEASEGRHRE